MKKLEKPDFSDGFGYLVNQESIPDKLRHELHALLPKKLDRANADNFLNLCAEEVQSAQQHARKITTGNIVTELKRIAKKAHDLRLALSVMNSQTSSVFTSYFHYLHIASTPPVQISQFSHDLVRDRHEEDGGMLSGAWDILSDLEHGALCAASQCSPYKRPTLKEVNAQALIRGISQKHYWCFGKLPTRSLGTWFPCFMEHLGGHYGLNCGPKMTRGVLLNMQRMPQYQK